MKQLLSAAWVKQSLAAHSWLGLLCGTVLYLICLSGTLAVLYPEWQRWEQADVYESDNIAITQLQDAYNTVLSQDKNTRNMYITLPRADIPRTLISSDSQGFYLNANGEPEVKIQHPWTDMLTNLHIYLHLPYTFGLIVSGVMGVMFCALILSGILAHPRIVMDAFRLRLGGNSARLQMADIHNRLSVWGAPFYLMLALTGASFGLAAPISDLFAKTLFQGNPQAVTAAVYGKEPTLQQPVQTANIIKPLLAMADIAPDTQPFYITVEAVGTAKQFTIVGAMHPQRLIFAEQYRFDSAGNYLDKVGFSDGSLGKQINFSLFRLHFGHFAGVITKVLYLVFGLAMTVVVVTGINIWLSRRPYQDAIHYLWVGFVWGTPLALSMTACLSLLIRTAEYISNYLVGLFWLTLLVSMVIAQSLKNVNKTRRLLQQSLIITLLLLLVLHTYFFRLQEMGSASWFLDSLLLLVALGFTFWVRRKALVK